jgi:hypothetical protein
MPSIEMTTSELALAIEPDATVRAAIRAANRISERIRFPSFSSDCGIHKFNM